MRSIPAITLILGIFAAVILQSFAEESPEISKRYLAALAKNGRLPKFANAQKKDQLDEESFQSAEKEEDEESSKDMLQEYKRHVGAFLRSRGRPIFTRSFSNPIHLDDEDNNSEGKRNIASMARLGKLNAMRFANVHGKRVDSEEISNNDEDNSINAFQIPDCFQSEPPSAMENRPIWMQKKRYVAALARSGRLPIWHSQRMWWGGKRDDSRPYATRSEEGSRDENAINDMAYTYAKNKRCKKMYDNQLEKRNVAALARNGKLPFRSSA